MKYLFLFLSLLIFLCACASDVSTHKALQPPLAPDLTVLYQKTQQNPILSATEIQDQQRIIDHQVKKAQSWLEDDSYQRRLAGARQLSAYPTSEAELALNLALQDQHSEVRAAAALSLSYFKTLNNVTLNRLIGSLEDSSLTVQQNALHTLSHYLSAHASNQPDLQFILRSLQERSHSTLLKEPTRQALLSLLTDLRMD